MSALTKWGLFRRPAELDAWRPSPQWNPFSEMEDMMRKMEIKMAQWPGRTQEAMTTAEWAPTVDVSETEKEFTIKAELPEVKKEDIKVRVENGTLSISGERKTEKEEKGTKFHRVERAYGRFERSFTVPDNTDADQITSECKEGVLTVHLPKTATTKTEAHQVPVK